MMAAPPAGPRASSPPAPARDAWTSAPGPPGRDVRGSGKIRVLPGEPHGLLAGLVEDGLVPVEVGHLEDRLAACPRSSISPGPRMRRSSSEILNPSALCTMMALSRSLGVTPSAPWNKP